MSPYKIKEVVKRLEQAIILVDKFTKQDMDMKQLKQSIFEILPYEFKRSFEAEDVVADTPAAFKVLKNKYKLLKLIMYRVLISVFHSSVSPRKEA